MTAATILTLLLFLAIAEGIGLGDQGINLRCKCINKEKKPIGRHLKKVEVYPPNSHCKDTEIIGTLKKDGQRICLDPSAPWVIKSLRRNQKRKQPKKQTKRKRGLQ
ncbi:interleukin-8-like [Sphaeramia orbicularis]|uniref:Interleukin-8-like n=1 Tax=Sphaeramia orbicularis TaxID=375764 RepID=A0A673C1G6_9TELE|nr:interleukin-8-like [Sphaeramia orbicularis]